MGGPGFSSRWPYRVVVALVGVANLVLAYLSDGVLMWTGLIVGIACLAVAFHGWAERGGYD